MRVNGNSTTHAKDVITEIGLIVELKKAGMSSVQEDGMVDRWPLNQ